MCPPSYRSGSSSTSATTTDASFRCSASHSVVTRTSFAYSAMREELVAHGCAQLRLGDRALELRLHVTVGADQEDPGLRAEAPLAHPAVVAARGVVAVSYTHLTLPTSDLV